MVAVKRKPRSPGIEMKRWAEYNDTTTSDAQPVQCHYPNQYWVIVSWALRNKLQWNLSRNTKIVIQESIFGNVVSKMNILFSGNHVKDWTCWQRVFFCNNILCVWRRASIWQEPSSPTTSPSIPRLALHYDTDVTSWEYCLCRTKVVWDITWPCWFSGCLLLHLSALVLVVHREHWFNRASLTLYMLFFSERT